MTTIRRSDLPKSPPRATLSWDTLSTITGVRDVKQALVGSGSLTQRSLWLGRGVVKFCATGLALYGLGKALDIYLNTFPQIRAYRNQIQLDFARIAPTSDAENKVELPVSTKLEETAYTYLFKNCAYNATIYDPAHYPLYKVEHCVDFAGTTNTIEHVPINIPMKECGHGTTVELNPENFERYLRKQIEEKNWVGPSELRTTFGCENYLGFSDQRSLSEMEAILARMIPDYMKQFDASCEEAALTFSYFRHQFKDYTWEQTWALPRLIYSFFDIISSKTQLKSWPEVQKHYDNDCSKILEGFEKSMIALPAPKDPIEEFSLADQLKNHPLVRKIFEERISELYLPILQSGNKLLQDALPYAKDKFTSIKEMEEIYAETGKLPVWTSKGYSKHGSPYKTLPLGEFNRKQKNKLHNQNYYMDILIKLDGENSHAFRRFYAVQNREVKAYSCGYVDGRIASPDPLEFDLDKSNMHLVRFNLTSEQFENGLKGAFETPTFLSSTLLHDSRTHIRDMLVNMDMCGPWDCLMAFSYEAYAECLKNMPGKIYSTENPEEMKP